MAALAMPACMGPEAEPATVEVPRESVELAPVIQIIEGEFDGTDFTFRTLQPDELIERGLMAPETTSADGVAIEPLVDLPSMACTPSTCTGVDYVALSGAAGTKRAITNGAAVTTPSAITVWGAGDVSTCGAVPGSSAAGVCQRFRVQNRYTQQLERVYLDYLSITPTGTTTTVGMAVQPYSTPTDFGLNPAVANGLFRVGELGRSTPATAAAGVFVHQAFTGTTTAPAGEVMTFTFLVQVRGLIVNATQRASIASGTLDAPSSDYPARTVVAPLNANLGISEDGRYVVFAGTGTIYRKDMSTGTLTTVASGCTTASNPHISTDGSVVVFQASGCDLTGEGAGAASPQIYAFDFPSSTMELITRSTTGGYATGTSQLPRVSATGTVVVFQSASTNLMTGTPTGRPGCVEVYRFDRTNGTMYHASAERFSDIFVPTDGWATGCTGSSVAGIAPDVSGDGNLVAFSAVRPLDTTSDTNARSDVYIYDQAATDSSGVAIVYRVSLRSTGAELTAGTAISAALSSDGAYIAFSTDATNVISGQTTTTSRRHIYRRTTAEGDDATIVRVTRRVDDGEPSGTTTGLPAISTSGRFVAFWSGANDLASVSGVFTVGQSEVYVCDMEAPVVALQRCWVASTLQPTSATAFSNLAGAISATSRIGLAYPNDIDAGYVVYQGAPSTGTWGSTGGQGQQVFVSPAGDPRYQQPVISP